jgi:hypothetical protein
MSPPPADLWHQGAGQCVVSPDHGSGRSPTRLWAESWAPGHAPVLQVLSGVVFRPEGPLHCSHPAHVLGSAVPLCNSRGRYAVALLPGFSGV